MGNQRIPSWHSTHILAVAGHASNSQLPSPNAATPRPAQLQQQQQQEQQEQQQMQPQQVLLQRASTCRKTKSSHDDFEVSR